MTAETGTPLLCIHSTEICFSVLVMARSARGTVLAAILEW
jgi:hypothetical protein